MVQILYAIYAVTLRTPWLIFSNAWELYVVGLKSKGKDSAQGLRLKLLLFPFSFLKLNFPLSFFFYPLEKVTFLKLEDFFLSFLATPQHMECPRPEIRPDLRCSCKQYWILNPLCRAWDLNLCARAPETRPIPLPHSGKSLNLADTECYKSFLLFVLWWPFKFQNSKLIKY